MLAPLAISERIKGGSQRLTDAYHTGMASRHTYVFPNRPELSRRKVISCLEEVEPQATNAENHFFQDFGCSVLPFVHPRVNRF